MRRLAWVMALILLSGCRYYIRLNEKTTSPQQHVDARPTFVNDVVVNMPCAQYGTDLTDVRFSSSLGAAWVSVLTFGAVNMIDVEYSCAPQTGVVPTPAPTPDVMPDGGT